MRDHQSPPAPLAEFLTPEQLAKALQVSPGTVCRLARAGRIPCHRFGHRTLRFHPDEVAKALQVAGQGATGEQVTSERDRDRVDRIVQDVLGSTTRGERARVGR